MNTDVEELLHEGMERFTRDLRAPAGMARRAARRRRRRALRSAAGAAAALTAGAVVLVAVVVPGAHHDGTGGRVVATAYMVKRVDSALSAAEPGAIAQMTVDPQRRDTWRRDGHRRGVVLRRPVALGHELAGRASGLRRGLPRLICLYPGQLPDTDMGAPAQTGRPGGTGRPFRPGHPKERAAAVPVSVPHICEPVFVAVPLLFQPGLPGIGARQFLVWQFLGQFAACDRPKPCATRSLAEPWPWLADSASTGSRQSS